jgi:hypothetical protein
MVITNFLSRKITLIVKGGCPPDRWGHGLQVMLEKVAGVSLVNKLRAILLMEADFNYMNRWVFGHEAISNQQNVRNWVHTGRPVQSKRKHSGGRKDGQSPDYGPIVTVTASSRNNVGRRR